MNQVQRRAAFQLFFFAYMIAAIIGLALQAKWGLVLLVALGVGVGLAIVGGVLWVIWHLVVELITGESGD